MHLSRRVSLLFFALQASTMGQPLLARWAHGIIFLAGVTTANHLEQKGQPMKFQITRTSKGAVSKRPMCKGAIRGAESPGWPGEYEWFVELNGLDELVKFLHATGGGLGLWAPEAEEEHPVIEIFDEDE
jgi:hypothetical protein